MGFRFTMQEGERDNRGSHAQEAIGWVAMSTGDHGSADHRLLSQNTRRRYSHVMRLVNFGQAFESTPSVIAKLGSSFGRDSANIRLGEVNADGFGVKVAEEQSRDREMNHIAEMVSYIAFPLPSGIID